MRAKTNRKKKTKPLTLGTWNVRTLLDRKDKRKNTDFQPERRTALVSKELSRYNIDIAALSETLLAGTGELEEVASGYTFYWKGKLETQKRESGVGFAVKSHLVHQLDGPPKGVTDRIMTLRLQLDKGRYATMISVYAPTMTNDIEVINSFYEEFDRLLTNTPKEDKLFLLEDLNARVGRDYNIWTDVIGVTESESKTVMEHVSWKLVRHIN